MKKVWQPLAVVCVLFVLSIFLLSCKNVKPELVLTQTQYQLKSARPPILITQSKRKDDMIVLFSSETTKSRPLTRRGK